MAAGRTRRAPPGPEHQVRAIVATPTGSPSASSSMLDVLPPRAARGRRPPRLDLLARLGRRGGRRRLTADPEVPVFLAPGPAQPAGIGNEFANELCFVRGLDPARPIGEVGDVPALVDLARRMLLATATGRRGSPRASTGRAGGWVFGAVAWLLGTRILRAASAPTRPACGRLPLPPLPALTALSAVEWRVPVALGANDHANPPLDGV